MRPIALGRRNYLFAGSDEGGQTWSILASLINSAKLNCIDPQEYLTDVLERIVSGRTKPTSATNSCRGIGRQRAKSQS